MKMHWFKIILLFLVGKVRECRLYKGFSEVSRICAAVQRWSIWSSVWSNVQWENEGTNSELWLFLHALHKIIQCWVTLLYFRCCRSCSNTIYKREIKCLCFLFQPRWELRLCWYFVLNYFTSLAFIKQIF